VLYLMGKVTTDKSDRPSEDLRIVRASVYWLQLMYI
jgi:hypothetical protein